MTGQTTILFDRKKARQKRDDGIKRAVLKADNDYENWSEIALEFLKGYAEINPKFMTEDVRYASQGIVPRPENERAWGGVILRARHLGWIYNHNNETAPVKNVNANCANAKIWRSKIVKR